MDITAIPNGGLNVSMKGYRRVRTYIGGPDFWHPSFQDVLRDRLSPFLPAMEYDSSSDCVNAKYVEKSKELLCSSAPLLGGGAMGRKIPTHVVEDFARALQRLRSALADPGIDPNARKMLEAFTLPEPTGAPELYRFVGSGKNTRMFIIWGMEHGPGSSVKAVDIDPETFFPKYLIDNGPNWKAVGTGAIILLALAGTLFYACSGDKEIPPPAAPTEEQPKPEKEEPKQTPEEKATADSISTEGAVPPGTTWDAVRMEVYSFDPETCCAELVSTGKPFTFKGDEKAVVEEIKPGKEYKLSVKEKNTVYKYHLIVIERPQVPDNLETEGPVPPAPTGTTGDTPTEGDDVDTTAKPKPLPTEGAIPPGTYADDTAEQVLEVFAFNPETCCAIMSPEGNPFTFKGDGKTDVKTITEGKEYTVKLKFDGNNFNYRLKVLAKPAVVKDGKIVSEDESTVVTTSYNIPRDENTPLTHADGSPVTTVDNKKIYNRRNCLVDEDDNPIYVLPDGTLTDHKGNAVTTDKLTTDEKRTLKNSRTGSVLRTDDGKIMVMPAQEGEDVTTRDGTQVVTKDNKTIRRTKHGLEDEDGNPIYVRGSSLTDHKGRTVTTREEHTVDKNGKLINKRTGKVISTESGDIIVMPKNEGDAVTTASGEQVVTSEGKTIHRTKHGFVDSDGNPVIVKGTTLVDHKGNKVTTETVEEEEADADSGGNLVNKRTRELIRTEDNDIIVMPSEEGKLLKTAKGEHVVTPDGKTVIRTKHGLIDSDGNPVMVKGSTLVDHKARTLTSARAEDTPDQDESRTLVNKRTREIIRTEDNDIIVMPENEGDSVTTKGGRRVITDEGHTLVRTKDGVEDTQGNKMRVIDKTLVDHKGNPVRTASSATAEERDTHIRKLATEKLDMTEDEAEIFVRDVSRDIPTGASVDEITAIINDISITEGTQPYTVSYTHSATKGKIIIHVKARLGFELSNIQINGQAADESGACEIDYTPGSRLHVKATATNRAGEISEYGADFKKIGIKAKN